MENILLIVHLILTLGLIGVVLLQRSEGGGLGMGGGGGGGMISARAAATALGRVTWFLGIGFFVTSLALTVIAAQKSASSSVLDRLGVDAAAPATDETPAEATPLGDDLLPPSGDAGLDTPRAD